MIIEAIRQVAGIRRLFQETTCGRGSMLKNTKGVRHFLESVIKQYQIKSILDVGCGDWNWMKHVDLSGIEYLGLDFDQGFILQNLKKYPQHMFEQWDAFKYFEGTIICPDFKRHHGIFDLIICRDLMLHLPTEVNLKLLREFDEVGKYLLISDNMCSKNVELPKGKYRRTCRPWRPVRLQLPPYNLSPVRVLHGGGEICMNRNLVLYKLPVMNRFATPQETHRAMDDSLTRNEREESKRKLMTYMEGSYRRRMQEDKFIGKGEQEKMTETLRKVADEYIDREERRYLYGDRIDE